MGARVVVGQQGRMVIPAEVRVALGIVPGDSLHVEVAGDQLVLRKQSDAARKLRGLFAGIEPGRSLVDELLAERRAEAAPGVTVLDASAVLAVLLDEPGADAVQDALDGASMGAANLAEVVGKTVDLGQDVSTVRTLLDAAGVVTVPVTREDAVLAGSLRSIEGGRTLSLGDRLCLALTLRSSPAVVLTADRDWALLDLPLTVQLIR